MVRRATPRFRLAAKTFAAMAGLVPVLLQAPDAQAQIALPSVQLPDAGIGGIVDVRPAIGSAADTAGLRGALDLRIRDLLRTSRATVEAGPRGMPILRSEVIAFSPTATALEAATNAGFTVVRERALSGLDTRVVTLAGPAGWSTRRALRRLRALDPDGVYDFNHLYFENAAAPPAAADVPVAPAATADTTFDVKVGLIDAGVDSRHPVFSGTAIHHFGCGGEGFPSAHGTAVASLLVGRADGFRGAVPGAELHAADVYCGSPTGGAVDAVAEALGWLVRERVPVINVSLVGPANVVLENVVRLVIGRGHVIVAAVGNDGPASPALYPAAYSGVVGVTAVDARHKVLVEAVRGRQVDFAAPGADMAAAAPAKAFQAVRGTSFAAPIVAGLIARTLAAPERNQAEAALQSLATRAVDLGSRGPDRTYGNGLVGQDLRVIPRLSALP